MNIIVTNYENKNIKNNFIYLSYDIIQELSLKENEKNIIKLTNIKDKNINYYFSWKGGIVQNKLKTSELSIQYFDLNEKYFFIEKAKENKNYLEKLTLIPLSNKDYNLIENNPDFFEENLINQIEIVFKNQIFTFFYNNDIIFLKVDNSNFECAFISSECEVNIQFIKENYEKYPEKRVEINFSKCNEIFSLKNNEICFLYKNSDLLCDYCNLNENNKNKFPYLNGIWISVDSYENIIELDLPKEVLISTSFFVSDILLLKKYNFENLYIDKDNNSDCYDYLKIEYLTEKNINFENNIQIYLPIVLTPFYIYHFNNVYFRLIISDNKFLDMFEEKNKPFLILDFENISKIAKIKSIGLKTIINYTILEKNYRYLDLKKIIFNYEDKELNDILKIIIYNNSIDIISYINDFFNKKVLTNILIIYLPNYFNEFQFSKQIMKLAKTNEIKYFYLNFTIFSYSLTVKKKVKKYLKDCYIYIKNYSQYKKMILIFSDLNDILNKQNLSDIFQKFLSNIKILENIYSILFLKPESKNFYLDNSYFFYKLNESISKEDNRTIPSIIKMKNKKSNNLEVKTKLNFSSLCNFSKIKNTITDIINLENEYIKFFPNKKIPIKLSSNILLIGPSGCGKTYLAKSIKEEFNINFYSIKLTDILSKFIGQSEENIRNIFEKAKKNSPSIIFIDELENLVSQRGISNSNLNDRIVNQILTYLDGIEENKKIIFIGATSNPYLIDNAILRPGRIDNIILCDYPDYNERIELIKFFIHHNYPNFNFNNINNCIEKLSKEIEYYSYADIYSGVYNSFYICEEKKCEMNDDILIRGFKEINKIINKEEVLLYKKIKEKGIYMEPSSKIKFA